MQSLNQQYYIREFKIWEIDTGIAINLYFGIITRYGLSYAGTRRASGRRFNWGGSRTN